MVKVTYSGLKMLETIITEDFFFYLGLRSRTFTIYRTTVEGRGYLFWWTNFSDKEFMGRIF